MVNSIGRTVIGTKDISTMDTDTVQDPITLAVLNHRVTRFMNLEKL